MKYLILMVALATFLSCHQKNNIVSNVDGENKNHFAVSFISIGSGIDYKTKLEFDQFLISFEQDHNISLDKKATNWGKEGEIDYCISLVNLNDGKQSLFITKAEKILAKSTLVRYMKNANCSLIDAN